jgi:hypothetical protein
MFTGIVITNIRALYTAAILLLAWRYEVLFHAYKFHQWFVIAKNFPDQAIVNAFVWGNAIR